MLAGAIVLWLVAAVAATMALCPDFNERHGSWTPIWEPLVRRGPVWFQRFFYGVLCAAAVGLGVVLLVAG